MKRKIKLLLMLLVSIVLTFLLYKFFSDKKNDILALGDSLAYGTTIQKLKGTSFNDNLKQYFQNKPNFGTYNCDYCIDSLTSKELLDTILLNEKYNEQNIKYLIHNAEIITLAIGIDEISNKGNINLYLYNIQRIISEIKAINNKNVFVIGLPLFNKKIKEINIKLKILCNNYEATYIDIENFYEKELMANNYYFKSSGHQKISEKIIAKIEKYDIIH